MLVLLLVFAGNIALAQGQSKKTVTGMVTDTAGIAIQGVSVVAETKTKVATQTDANGRFVLDVDLGTILRFSFVGFNEQKVTVTANTQVINIKLKDANMLSDQVVITAMGQKQRREAVVGSVTTIKPSALKIPASNLTNALAGQAAGIIAYQQSGQPGQDNASFFVRGVTTFGYKQDPLILIDNVELSASDLARLQVDDIASFSILKDASATSLYGARGGNGVILVTTKEGVAGRAKVSVRLENSFSQAVQQLDIVDPITYMNMYNEATLTRNPSAVLLYSPTKILNTKATLAGAPGSNPYVYPAVDWLDKMFKKTTSTKRANMSVNGGGGVARYYVAGSYSLDNGVLKEDANNNNNNNVKFQNFQLRSNVNIDLTKTTELVVRLSGNFNEYNGPLTADGGFSTDLYNVAVHASPVLFPAYYEPDPANEQTRHILFGNARDLGGNLYTNPYANLLKGHKNSSESRMSAQLELNQDLNFITPGLNFRGIFSTNRYSYFESQMSYKPFFYNIGTYDKLSNQYTLNWLNTKVEGGEPEQAQEYLSYNGGEPSLSTFYYVQAALSYNRTFGNHTVSSSLIGTGQQTLYSNAKDPKTKTVTLQSSLPYRNLGLAGRATYSYKGKYFLEFNFGLNGSERFSVDHRFGFFPTIGAGYLVSGEKFWQPIAHVVDRFKLRASYGLVGNDAIGTQRFFYLSDLTFNAGGNYAQFGINNSYERKGIYTNNYANPDVTWETSKQTNIALEFSLLKKINVIAEVYRNHKYDILQERAYIPSSLGLEVKPYANIGKADSKGIDLSVDYKETFQKDWWASVRGNFTYASNKYEYIEEPKYKEAWRYYTGQPINRGYGYIAERLFVDDVEARNSPTQTFSTNGIPPKGGDIKYRDLNNDGKIDILDLTFLGNPQVPQIVYGFGFSTGYKNFDISAFFQGQAKVSFFIDASRVSPFIPSPDNYIRGTTQMLTKFAENHWSEENQNLYALYPRLGTTKNDIENNLQPSSWWLRDGSFLRLKSVEIGYTLPQKVASRLKLSNCRIYFNGLNLFTWSKFNMWDVEQGGKGFNYPIQKVFNIGLNVSL